MTKSAPIQPYRNFIRHKHLTAEQKAHECVKMYKRGWKVSAIAWLFGISETRVYQLFTLHRRGVGQ